MSRRHAVQMINDKARISAAQVFFQPEGQTKLYSFGNVQGCDFTPNIEEWDDVSVESGQRQIVGSYVLQADGAVALRTRSWTEIAYQMALMSGKSYDERSAQAAVETVFEDVEVGDIYRTAKRAEIKSASDGDEMDPTAWVEGVNFTYHYDSGVVQILSVPDGAANKLALEIDEEAIAASDRLLKLDVLGSDGVTGRLLVIGTNRVGQRGELELARVQFRPDGAVPFTSGSGASEGDEVSLTGRVYATDSGYGTWTSYGAV